MTHQIPVPTKEQARTGAAELHAETGRAPSALAVAIRLALANTTFRRRFPTVVDDLARQRRGAPARTTDTTGAAGYTALRATTTDCAPRFATSPTSSTLALATIQHLAEANHQLTGALHRAHAVRTLRPPTGPADDR